MAWGSHKHHPEKKHHSHERTKSKSREHSPARPSLSEIKIHHPHAHDTHHLQPPTPRPITPAETPAPIVPEMAAYDRMDSPTNRFSENGKVKMAMIGLGSSVVSAGFTAFVMWLSKSCDK